MSELMKLKILLPFRVFAEVRDVRRVVLETTAGSYGLLPQRLDCTAALVAGILEYEDTNGKVHYVAVSDGIFVKAGQEVLISVHNAIGNAELGMLRQTVETDFRRQSDRKTELRTVMAKLESNFVRNIQQLKNG